MNPTMMRSSVSRQGSAFVIVAALLLAFVIAALADADVAGKVAHEPRDMLETSVFLSRFGLSGYMLVLSATMACVAIAVQRRAESTSLATRRGSWPNARSSSSSRSPRRVFSARRSNTLLGRARPRFLGQFGAYHFAGPSFRSGIDSFPSGHTTTVFAAAVVFSLFKPSWKAGFFAVAVAIGLARILAGAHYPSDVLAGAVLGSTVASVLGRSFQEPRPSVRHGHGRQRAGSRRDIGRDGSESRVVTDPHVTVVVRCSTSPSCRCSTRPAISARSWTRSNARWRASVRSR